MCGQERAVVGGCDHEGTSVMALSADNVVASGSPLGARLQGTI